MSILIAVAEPTLAAILRNHFESARLDVIDNDVLHRKYLSEIIEIEEPDMVILHDTYLPSDFEEQLARDEEMLEIINKWRVEFNDSLRVVYLCERDRRDPFLGKLVAHNVLDIFNERKIIVEQFVEQLSAPPKYANVSKYGVGGLELEFDEVVEVTEMEESQEVAAPPTEKIQTEKAAKPSVPKGQKTKEILESVKGNLKSVKDAGEEWKQQRIKEKEMKESIPKEPKSKPKPKAKLITSSDIDFNEIIDLMPIPKEVYNRPQIVGTVVIAVAGVQPHLGATHTAMSIASYLQNQQHSVALIELNDSEDFDRIHALYEGEQHFLRNENKFTYKGIDHYKYREDLRLGEIIPTYEYVVLDIGAIEESRYFDEFQRSHVRCLLVSPYEWKGQWIKEFTEQITDPDQYIYLVPFVGKSLVRDVEERFPQLQFVRFTADENPYKVIEEGQKEIIHILDGFLKEDKKGFSQKKGILISVTSVVVTLLIVTAFQFL
ncbi:MULTISPECIES: hypothetical protein [unclassified Psychrobacillus]|uniref:hypothetical protein n=1 Tax=unclassified Psychrobacillus TaxID=2636677 RepID=UPI0030FB9C26